MSAFVCNPEHIAALAAYAAVNHCGGAFTGLPSQQVGILADDLLNENIRSVQHRYPDCNDDMMPGPICDDIVRQVRSLADMYCYTPPKSNGARLTPIQIIKMAQCYRYQSCEHDGWHDSSADRMTLAIINHAISKIDGYDSAEWGYTDNAAGWRYLKIA